MSALNDRVVLVTGAGRGIGRALADRFLAEGAACVLTVRSADAENALRHALDARADIERCDIAHESQVAALRNRVAARHGRVDVLVNNAGYFDDDDRTMHATNVTQAVLRRTFDVNLFGTIAMCTAFAPLVPEGGRIINVSSTMGQLQPDGLPDYAVAYSVSKTALNAYTTSLANELKGRGVMADALHPGWVQTEMGGPNAKISPQEATETVVFLATRAFGETGKFWLNKRIIAW